MRAFALPLCALLTAVLPATAAASPTFVEPADETTETAETAETTETAEVEQHDDTPSPRKDEAPPLTTPDGSHSKEGVAAFTRVEVAGAVDLELTGERRTHTARISCPTRNGPGVQLKVRGTTLHVSPKHEGRRLGDCVVTLGAPRITGIEIAGASEVEGRDMKGLEELSIAGAGEFELRGIDSDRLDIQISGAGEAELEGRVGELRVSLAGAGEVEAKDLTARTARLSIAGAGEIETTVTESVQASTAGAGDIDIYGNPKNVDRTTRGAGRVKVH